MSAEPPLLEVANLSVRLRVAAGERCLVDGLSFTLPKGGALGLVGESGSGKSVTALALIGLLPATMRAEGSVRLEGEELIGQTDRAWSRHRGRHIALVFQDPASSLNPYLTIGTQLSEMLVYHLGHSQAEAYAESKRLLEAVRIPDAARRLTQYPHELSGGQRQRVTLAMALSCKPRLLIADEPTTALDMTLQAQILTLLADLLREFQTALLLITHDLSVVAEVCDRVLVLYAGRMAECAAVDELLRWPTHPYTVGLLRSRSRLDSPPARRLPTLDGQPPGPEERLPGCAFAPRCNLVTPDCAQQRPTRSSPSPGWTRYCHRDPQAVYLDAAGTF